MMEQIAYRGVSFVLGEGRLAEVISFFIYDSIKILLLLLIITHLMGMVRRYLPIEKIRDALASRDLFGADHLLAAVFGAITPFCSCSSIPLFIGFLEAGIPLGVTFSFLITSPLVNEIAVALFIGLFGVKITIIYVAAGLCIGIFGGIVLGRMRLERYIESYVWNISARKIPKEEHEGMSTSWIILFKNISRDAFTIMKKITPYVLFGVALGAVIHGYIPNGFFERYISKENPFAVPLAVILALPLYSNASGVIPVVQALVEKGIPLGTALAFMMATVGLSLPEALILKRVMKTRLVIIFFSVVAFGMMLIGYGFNIFL